MLIESAVITVKSTVDETSRNLGARLATLESTSGDAWAARAEARRQGSMGAPTEASASAPVGGFVFDNHPSLPYTCWSDLRWLANASE